MRTYEQSHRWIDFILDLKQASYRLWLLLGQATAKCDQVAGVPLMPGIAEELRTVFLAKGALATTAIEGNTLTEDQVRQRIEGKLQLPPSKEYLGQEIDNILKAYSLIGQQTLANVSTLISTETLKDFNRLVLTGLPLDEDVEPGEIRQHRVTVGRYLGAPPEDLEFLMEKLCTWLNNDFVGLDNPMTLGILKAIIAHLYIAWIHPFGDGNGRTARLLEFQILLSVGVPDNAAHLLSNHYNQTRLEYYRHLDLSHREEDGVFRFVEYSLQGFVDGLDDQIQRIEEQQLEVHWRDYVYEQFRNRDDTEAKRRCRRLVLDLARQTGPVPMSEIRHISTRLAEAYANKTDKTVRRDLKFLEEEMGLIQRRPDGYIANKSIMRAFIPGRRMD